MSIEFTLKPLFPHFCVYHAATCDPAALGGSPTSVNSYGTVTISNGVIVYNGVGVGSTAYLICNDSYSPGVDSSNRTCTVNGIWSGKHQICVSLLGSCKLYIIIPV